VRGLAGADESAVRFRRIAVVGCGKRFSSAIAPALVRLGVQPVLLVDPSPSALDDALASLEANGRPFLAHKADEETLREAGPDAVIIASPSGMHFRHASTALELGLAAYVEKPMTRTAKEGQRLVDTVDARAAQGTLARLSVSEQRTYRPDLLFIRRLLQSGDFGELRRVTYYDSIARTPHFAASWRNDPDLAGGGVLFDLGYHTVATLHWLLCREPCDARRFAVECAWVWHGDLHVEEGARVVAVAAAVEVELTVRLDGHDGVGQERLTVEGSQGSATLVRHRAKGSVSTLTLSRRSRSRTMAFDIDQRFDTESLRDFVRTSPRLAPAEQLPRHIRTLEFIEQAYAAAQGG
jgi:predicted dehydrogenase